MSDNKTLILAYIKALSGVPKTADLISTYVSDAALAQHIADVEAGFPCYELSVELVIAEGDLVVFRGQFHGIHKGAFAGIPPTGRAVSAGLIIIYRVEEQRIVQHWMQFDLFGLLQQLQGSGAAAD